MPLLRCARPWRRALLLLLPLLAPGCASEPTPYAVELEARAEDPDAPAGDDAPPRPGEAATVVYVTRMGSRANARPAAIVYCSDPQNAHYGRKSSQTVNVKRMEPAEMTALLTDLEAQGLDSLPWQDFEPNAQISEGRAIYLYRAGRCRVAWKEGLRGRPLSVFSKIESILIRLTTALE